MTYDKRSTFGFSSHPGCRFGRRRRYEIRYTRQLGQAMDLLLGMISRRDDSARIARSLISVQNDELGAIKPQKETIQIFARVSVLS